MPTTRSSTTWTIGELERLLHVLKEDGPKHRSVRLIALFLLSTGARLNEALRARWQDIDWGNRIWRIPARTSKSKRVRSVPLNDSALEVPDRLGNEEVGVGRGRGHGRPHSGPVGAPLAPIPVRGDCPTALPRLVTGTPREVRSPYADQFLSKTSSA